MVVLICHWYADISGAVCVYPWCHIGGVSLRWHHDPGQSASLGVLRHEPLGPADQLQPDQRGVQSQCIKILHIAVNTLNNNYYYNRIKYYIYCIYT